MPTATEERDKGGYRADQGETENRDPGGRRCLSHGGSRRRVGAACVVSVTAASGLFVIGKNVAPVRARSIGDPTLEADPDAAVPPSGTVMVAS